MSEEQARTRLVDLPGWELEGKALARRYLLPSFTDAIAFVNRVAELAAQVDHHPDITINYNRVSLYLWSHDAGGVTARDFRLARLINAVPQSGG